MKRRQLCRNGNTVERFYDRRGRYTVTIVVDPEGNQVGDADYAGNKGSADACRELMIRDNGGAADPLKNKSK